MTSLGSGMLLPAVSPGRTATHVDPRTRTNSSDSSRNHVRNPPSDAHVCTCRACSDAIYASLSPGDAIEFCRGCWASGEKNVTIELGMPALTRVIAPETVVFVRYAAAGEVGLIIANENATTLLIAVGGELLNLVKPYQPSCRRLNCK